MYFIKLALILVIFLNPIYSNAAAKAALIASQVSAESFPYSTSWQISQATPLNSKLLLNWSIQTDLNYPFYRNLPSISQVFSVGSVNASSQLIPFEGFGTLNTPAQMQVGIQDSRHYFTSWQLISTFAYFGGSHDEGQVLAPSPGWIRAAHRNGVKILGTVYFSPDPSEGAWVQQFLTQDSQGSFPYAKALIDIAHAYHFDGYFINEESVMGNVTVQNQFLDFFKYFHSQADDLLLSWYQVPGLPINPMFISDPSSRSSTPFFIDYGGFSALADWVAAADQVSCPRSILGFGVNAEEATTGQDQKQYFDSLSGPNGGYSLSVFDLSQIILKNSGQDPPTSTAAPLMQNYWEGNADWVGAQSYVNRASPLQALPFSTEFSTGFGEKFFLAGELAFESPWHDLGIQDYLPTKQFDLQQQQSNISASFDFSDAYSGGNSLSYQGTLVENDLVTSQIFATQWVVGSSDVMELTYKSPAPSAALCLDTGTTQCYSLSTPNEASAVTNTTWIKERFPLTDLSGKSVKAVELRILSPSTNTNYSLRLGKLYIGPVTAEPEGPSHFQAVSLPGQDQSGNWHIYASWDNNTEVSYYNMYIKYNSTDEPKFLARTSNNIADYAVGETLPSVISVQAVSPIGDVSPLVDWTLDTAQKQNLRH